MNTQMKHIVIIGATSSIAEACTRLWLKEEPCTLSLVGRDQQRLERVAADLRVRSPQSNIRSIQADFLKPEQIEETVGDITRSGRVDLVLIAHGALPSQDICQDSLTACYDALEVNGVSPVLYAEAFAKKMAEENYGKIVLIGSVAGDRGRKSNYAYGAAKGLVSRYTQGLQHRFAGTNVKVILIKPGPTATPMTSHLQEKGVACASVDDVAKNICEGVNKNKSVIYTPPKWKIIMFIIKHIPACIFNKLSI